MMAISPAWRRVLSRFSALGLLGVAVALGCAVLSLPAQRSGLEAAVQAAAVERGLENPVTVVLLDVRGYDTLLELAVLLLAAVGVRVFAHVGPLPHRLRDAPADPQLEQFVQLLAPFMVLVGGYLLWAGSASPGGAFQAGAVVAATGILLTVSGFRLPKVADWQERLLLSLGPLVFAFVATGLLSRGRLLEYPQSCAKTLILLIEIAATISIAATLLMLFLAKPIGIQARLMSEEETCQ